MDAFAFVTVSWTRGSMWAPTRRRVPTLLLCAALAAVAAPGAQARLEVRWVKLGPGTRAPESASGSITASRRTG